MVISHVMIIADSALCFNAILGVIFGQWGYFLYNKQNNTWILGNMKKISHSFASPTHEISWSTLKINFIFWHFHVLFS